jgi:hypothetical protein
LTSRQGLEYAWRLEDPIICYFPEEADTELALDDLVRVERSVVGVRPLGVDDEHLEWFRRWPCAGASVVGINDMTMNKHLPFRVLDSAFQHWRFGSPAQIPSGAALYTQPGRTIIANISTPNSLPADASEGVFLAPQAAVPLTGSVWGLGAQV